MLEKSGKPRSIHACSVVFRRCPSGVRGGLRWRPPVDHFCGNGVVKRRSARSLLPFPQKLIKTSLCVVFAPISFSSRVSYRCLPGFRTSTLETSLCAVFENNVFSSTRNATSNAKHRHFSHDMLVSRGDAKTQEVSRFWMTCLPFTP